MPEPRFKVKGTDQQGRRVGREITQAGIYRTVLDVDGALVYVDDTELEEVEDLEEDH